MDRRDEMRFAQVWTLRDGRGVRMQLYASVEEALEAVGLSEQDALADSRALRERLSR